MTTKDKPQVGPTTGTIIVIVLIIAALLVWAALTQDGGPACEFATSAGRCVE